MFEIRYANSHAFSAKAADKDTNTRAIFVLAAKKPPYNVYGNPFYDYAGYGNVFSVDREGGLEGNVQNYEYEPKAGVHGMVFDSTETYLYSADMGANKIWAHKKDLDTGYLELIGSVEAPSVGDHPRWVELHPDGHYLYVLMESGNRLCVYLIDQKTHMPVFTQITYPLIPPGALFELTNVRKSILPWSGLSEPGEKVYRADVVFLSHSKNYLFATARANKFHLTGYVSAFKVSPNGSIERHICMNPTPTSGGHSNVISPCDWSDEWLALTDDQEGFVEIYRWHEEFLGRVAHLDIKEPGFGMNAIWYD